MIITTMDGTPKPTLSPTISPMSLLLSDSCGTLFPIIICIMYSYCVHNKGRQPVGVSCGIISVTLTVGVSKKISKYQVKTYS